MLKFLNSIEKIDLFGVPVPLLTQAADSKFQSKVGGILSIVLGCLSLAYMLYIFTLWSNNLIPPTVSSQQKTISYTEFTFSEPLIEIELQDVTNDVDPFRKVNNIITPLLYTMINSTIIKESIPLFSSPEFPYIVSLNNGSLVLNNLESKDIDNNLESMDENHLQMKQYLIVLTKCSNSSLLDGGFCADEQVDQLNQKTREFDVFKKQYYTSFDLQSPMYSQIMLKQQETIIDDGILFNNYLRYNSLNNYEMINQQVDNSFVQRVFSYLSETPLNLDNYGCYLFRIDNISLVEEVTMPKLGQILAQIGSIVQLLFLLKYAALYYNYQLMENDLLHDIISMYYPELKGFQGINFIQKKFCIEKNIKNQQLIQAIHQSLIRNARQKCRLNNIIYELSRIQLILQKQFGIEVLTASHLLGDKFENHYMNHENEIVTNRLLIKPIDSIDLQEAAINKEPLELLIKQT